MDFDDDVNLEMETDNGKDRKNSERSKFIDGIKKLGSKNTGSERLFRNMMSFGDDGDNADNSSKHTNGSIEEIDGDDDEDSNDKNTTATTTTTTTTTAHNSRRKNSAEKRAISTLKKDENRFFSADISKCVQAVKFHLADMLKTTDHNDAIEEMLQNLPHDEKIVTTDIHELHSNFYILILILESAFKLHVRIESRTVDVMFDELGLYAASYSSFIEHQPIEFFCSGTRRLVSLELDISRILMYACFVSTSESFTPDKFSSSSSSTKTTAQSIESLRISDLEFVGANSDILYCLLENEQMKTTPIFSLDMQTYIDMLVIVENACKRLMWNEGIILFIQVLFLRAALLLYVPNSYCNIERYSKPFTKHPARQHPSSSSTTNNNTRITSTSSTTGVIDIGKTDGNDDDDEDENKLEMRVANDEFVSAIGQRLMYILRTTVFMRHFERIDFADFIEFLPSNNLAEIMPTIFRSHSFDQLVKLTEKWLEMVCKSMKRSEKLHRKLIDRHVNQTLLEAEERSFRQKEPDDLFYDQYYVFEEVRQDEFRDRITKQHSGTLSETLAVVDDQTVIEYGKYLVFAEYIKIHKSIRWAKQFACKTPDSLLHERYNGMTREYPIFATLFMYPAVIINSACLPSGLVPENGDIKIACIDCGNKFARAVLAWLILLRYYIGRKGVSNSEIGIKIYDIDDIADQICTGRINEIQQPPSSSSSTSTQIHQQLDIHELDNATDTTMCPYVNDGEGDVNGTPFFPDSPHRDIIDSDKH